MRWRKKRQTGKGVKRSVLCSNVDRPVDTISAVVSVDFEVVLQPKLHAHSSTQFLIRSDEIESDSDLRLDLLKMNRACQCRVEMIRDMIREMNSRKLQL